MPFDYMLFVVFIFILYRLISRLRQHRSHISYPPGPPGLPFIGSIRTPPNLAWVTYNEWSKEYGQSYSLPSAINLTRTLPQVLISYT